MNKLDVEMQDDFVDSFSKRGLLIIVVDQSYPN